MVSRREIIKAVRSFYRLSDGKFRESLYTLLEVLTDAELLELMMCTNDPFLRMKSYEILEKRGYNIVNNCVEHDDGISRKNSEAGRVALATTDNNVHNKASKKLKQRKKLKAKKVEQGVELVSSIQDA